MLKEVTASALATMIAELKPFDELLFHHRESPDDMDGTFGAARLPMFYADVVYLNYVGGAMPYLIDISRESQEAETILEALMQYLKECSPNTGKLFVEDYGVTTDVLAGMLMNLMPGQEIILDCSVDKDDSMRYGARLIRDFGAEVIYLNCVDGGNPFVKDITSYYEEKTERELALELHQFFADATSGAYQLILKGQEGATAPLPRILMASYREKQRFLFSVVTFSGKDIEPNTHVKGGVVKDTDDMSGIPSFYELTDNISDLDTIEVQSSIYAVGNGADAAMPDELLRMVRSYGSDEFVALNRVSRIAHHDFTVDTEDFR